MPTQTSLLESYDLPNAANRPTNWLLVTNQLNLLYMLAAGLIMSPKGFGKKYYQDPLCNYPGWIPLFAHNVPLSAIEHAVSEKKHLKPCLATIRLSSLRGKVKAVSSDSSIRDVMLPDELAGNEQILLIPAPLPVTWIEYIIFQSRDDKSNCESDARDFGNVPLSNFKRKVDRQFFPGKNDVVWPPTSLELPDQDRPMGVSFAAGAMMTMLLRMANLGDIGKESSKLAFDAEDGAVKKITGTIISALGDWKRIGRTPEDTADIFKKLFWGAVDRLIIGQSSEKHESARDVILRYLESSAEELEDKLKHQLLKLAGDLKKLAGFGNSTITELFECHPNSFSRVMTLFFLRETCADLLEFRHQLLTEKDYLVAAILFAARDGWLGLPLELRDYSGLQEAVPHRMAEMAHRIANTGLELGSAPPRPKSLLELFTQGPRGWNKAQREAALSLAQDCKWSGIQTRITLGKGEYRLEVDDRGMHILINGEAKAVVTEVNSDRFFSDLARERLTSKQEQKIRDLLKV